MHSGPGRTGDRPGSAHPRRAGRTSGSFHRPADRRRRAGHRADPGGRSGREGERDVDERRPLLSDRQRPVRRSEERRDRPAEFPGPSSAIQAGATPSWTVQVPPAIVQAAVQQDDLKGFGGVRVQFSLQVDNGDPHGPVFAEKILLFSPPRETVNHNPRIESLELTRDGVPAGTLQAGDPLSVRVGVEMGILPHLATGEGGAETYTAIDLRGKALTLTEAPRYSFFTTSSGDLDVATADEPLPGTRPLEGLVRFTALRRGAGTLWIVVRDGRGGLGWLEVSYQAS